MLNPSRKLRITLSCGEQTFETYQRWFNSGARRYLLRIESSDQTLYYKIHPRNRKHNFKSRIVALENLKKAERMFQEMGMDYWLERTKRVLEKL